MSIKRTRLLITLSVLVLLISGTVLAIQIAKGYRPNLKKMSLNGMGLLSTSSYPKSAQVFVNDRLTTVTDDTLYLNPGNYSIKIIKNGFYPWTKSVPVKAEIVSLTEARLFPTIPSITPLTFYQVDKPLLSPDGTKIAYLLLNSPFGTDNGLYIYSLNNNLLGNQFTQIASLSTFDFTKSDLSWSPDGTQILAVISDGKKITSSRLFNAKSSSTTNNQVDETSRLPQLFSDWQNQVIKINQSHLTRFPDFMVNVASTSAVNVYFSPDGEKMFYTATVNTSLPENLIGKALTNINSTPETRSLETGKTYIYDRKEGTNYLIKDGQFSSDTAVKLISSLTVPTIATPSVSIKTNTKKTLVAEVDSILTLFKNLKGQLDPVSTQNLSWFPDSAHLVVRNQSAASIIDYDGLNSIPLTSSDLKNNFAVPSPDGNRLIVLSNLNQKPDTFNLISLDLK